MNRGVEGKSGGWGWYDAAGGEGKDVSIIKFW